jgi:hypothetical protein
VRSYFCERPQNAFHQASQVPVIFMKTQKMRDSPHPSFLSCNIHITLPLPTPPTSALTHTASVSIMSCSLLIGGQKEVSCLSCLLGETGFDTHIVQPAYFTQQEISLPEMDRMVEVCSSPQGQDEMWQNGKVSYIKGHCSSVPKFSLSRKNLCTTSTIL